MKYFLIFILLLSIAIPSTAQIVETIVDSTPPYSVWQGLPGQGFINKADAKNEKVNGLRQGKWVEYLNNVCDTSTDLSNIGNPVAYLLVIYSEGKPLGIVRKYNIRGTLIYETPYVNGERNGLEIAHWTGCNVSSPYKDDKKNGVEKWFWGKLIMEKPYKNGKLNGIEKHYSHDTLESETTFIDGKKNGVEKVYYRNGILKEERFYVNDEKGRKSKQYYENGVLQAEMDSIDNGVWYYKSYFECGNIESMGIYKSDTNRDEYLYYESGRLKTKYIALNSNENQVDTMYYENGNLQSTSRGYLKGAEEKQYYEDGKLHTVTVFNYPEPGTITTYDENGNVISTAPYYIQIQIQ